MSRKRFFVHPERIRDGIASLPPDQVHHLRDVLRLGAGDQVEVFDGQGAAYLGTVDGQGSETRITSLQKLSSAEPPHGHVTLAPALFKSDRFEWMLQKVTELGVDEIVPLETRFSEIRIPQGKLDSRLERWRRIVREASKQSRRTSIPLILRPVKFNEFIFAERLHHLTRILLYEKATMHWSNACLPTERVLVCIGAEGGWHADEIETALGAGFGVFSLGPTILRAETAAVAALAIIQFGMQTRKTQG